MSIEFNGGRSCQFFYFNYSKSKKHLSDKLADMNKMKKNNRIKIKYDGDIDDDNHLKGVMLFDHHSGKHSLEFTFNLQNNLLLIVGNSTIRKQAVLEFVKLFFSDDSLNTPFARMTAKHSRNVIFSIFVAIEYFICCIRLPFILQSMVADTIIKIIPKSTSASVMLPTAKI